MGINLFVFFRFNIRWCCLSKLVYVCNFWSYAYRKDNTSTNSVALPIHFMFLECILMKSSHSCKGCLPTFNGESYTLLLPNLSMEFNANVKFLGLSLVTHIVLSTFGLLEMNRTFFKADAIYSSQQPKAPNLLWSLCFVSFRCAALFSCWAVALRL